MSPLKIFLTLLLIILALYGMIFSLEKTAETASEKENIRAMEAISAVVVILIFIDTLVMIWYYIKI